VGVEPPNPPRYATALFKGVTPCGVMKVYESFEGACVLHIQSGIHCLENMVSRVNLNVCIAA
jgi:hypothetical protein